ncbi:VWA domain-containing protein [Lysinibacillus sp. 54212]|uniref:VWA domain-containing protein n=1 Tax=Lysinibacillus sp. 54212 TaxID=3119829 RepID=UPI002FCA20C8
MKRIMAIIISSVLLFASYLPFAIEAQAASISDMKKTDAKYTAANWAVDNGLISLNTGRKFNPNNAITEAQLVRMFAKLDRNYPHSLSTDMLYNYYGEIHIPLNGTLSVSKRNGSVTRGGFAKIYAAMHGLDLSEVHAVQYLYVNEITSGTSGKKTYESYMPKKTLTRGDAAVFLYRMAKKGKIAVDGLTSPAKGKDNNKITLPINFVESGGSSVDLGDGQDGNNDVSDNTSSANKAVQKITVENAELIANGKDSTLVSIKLKDGYGKTIPYETSLQFKVSSKLTLSGKTDEDGNLIQGGFASNSPSGAPTATVFSDGGDLDFYIKAPKLPQSVRDTIYLELVNNNEARYSVFKNKRIEIPIQYVPQPELQVTYEIYDSYNEEYVGGDDGDETKYPITYPTLKPGPISVSAIDPDDKTLYLASSNQDSSLGTVVTEPVYEHATVRLAGFDISEQLFEHIISDYLKEGSSTTITLDYFLDGNGFAGYNIPFSAIPNKYTSPFNADDPQSHAVLLYLIDLLPKKIDSFSMANYKSIKAVQAIYARLSEAEINNSALANYRSELNGLLALAELADKTLQDIKDAEREKLEGSFTKVMVSLVAPGGLPITNYRGPVNIEYNGVVKQTYFNTNTVDNVTNTGGTKQAIAIFEGLIYGTSEVKVTLPKTNSDTRYHKLLASLYDKPVSNEIFATTPIDDRSCSLLAEIAFVVDNSASMKKVDPRNLIGAKTKELIKKMDAEPTIAATFSTKGTLEKKGTVDQVLFLGDDLFNAGNRNGGTNMLEGVKTAIANFESAGDRTMPKALILVSDGNTKAGEVSQMIQLAKNAGVKIYTITVGKPSETNQTLMKKLANDTGGMNYHVTNHEDISGVYQTVYDKVICNYTGSTAMCSINVNMFNEAKITILRNTIFFEAALNPNCTDVNKVKVNFYSVGGNLQYDLFSIGHNMFELEYDIRKVQNFDIYEEVEFFAYDKNGAIINSKKVKIQ